VYIVIVFAGLSDRSEGIRTPSGQRYVASSAIRFPISHLSTSSTNKVSDTPIIVQTSPAGTKNIPFFLLWPCQRCHLRRSPRPECQR